MSLQRNWPLWTWLLPFCDPTGPSQFNIRDRIAAHHCQANLLNACCRIYWCCFHRQDYLLISVAAKGVRYMVGNLRDPSITFALVFFSSAAINKAHLVFTAGVKENWYSHDDCRSAFFFRCKSSQRWHVQRTDHTYGSFVLSIPYMETVCNPNRETWHNVYPGSCYCICCYWGGILQAVYGWDLQLDLIRPVSELAFKHAIQSSVLSEWNVALFTKL